MKAKLVLFSFVIFIITARGQIEQVAVPICGNDVFEVKTESCEISIGSNCGNDCQCQGQFTTTDPASENCLTQDKSSLKTVINCSQTPTFVCVDTVEAEYLSCSNSSIAFESCPFGTVCPSSQATRTTSLNSPCNVPSSNYSRCDLVEPSESCELGGILCGDDCQCVQGAIQTNPRTVNCVNSSPSGNKTCGNGVIDQTNEQCENSGANCFSNNCTCQAGFVSTVPPSVHCLPKFMANLNDLCKKFTGFACLENVTTQYLQCSSNQPAFFQCPGGSVCRNTTAISAGNPCSPINTTIPICGNGVVENNESCEISGSNCTVNCTCANNTVPSVPVSKHCVIPAESNLQALCGNNTAGFLCLTGLNTQYLTCEKGAIRIRECPLNTSGCTVGKNITTFNPCIASSKRLCGNGQIDPQTEQCDGGNGCLQNCTCGGNLVATQPPTTSCTTCGNGVIDTEEQCDGGQGCSNACQCSENFTVSDPISVNCSLCGNRVINDNEECDGGNNCLKNCSCAPGFSPTNPISENCTSLCGNGAIDGSEQCDGGRNCTSNCTCSSGSIPTNPPSINCTPSNQPQNERSIPSCGDGVADYPDEECDSGYGCQNCRCIEGFIAASPPSRDCVVLTGQTWWWSW